MAQFIRQHLLLLAAFGLAGTLTLVFVVRFVASTVMWSDPALAEQDIAGWMTPRYVSRVWDLPPEVVARSLALRMDGSGRRLTLAEIATAQGRSVDDLIGALNDAIATGRSDD